MPNYDKIIFGAGLYGLYAAHKCGKAGQSVLVIERDSAPFMRATFINQACVHMGYHYPRSYSTAIKSAKYFERFCEDFGFCIHKDFEQIYATSSNFSWTNASEFVRFCKAANIRCDGISPNIFFKDGMCDGAFITTEYTYDAMVLRDYYLNEFKSLPNVKFVYGQKPEQITKIGDVWEVKTNCDVAQAPFILNATYAGVNDIHNILGFQPFKIKYEKCEIILVDVCDKLKNIGLTVMDGPFFSIMPFGKTGLHSLTSVTFTPHETCYENNAVFACQSEVAGGAVHTAIFAIAMIAKQSLKLLGNI